MPDDPVARRHVARLLAGQVVQGLGVLSAASASLSEAASGSFASLLESPAIADSGTTLGRGPGGSMWVRARVADPSLAATVDVSDGTALLRLLREGVIQAGPVLAPLTAAALAGTARAVAAMDVDARANASSAIAGLIGRARPDSGAVRLALDRSAPIIRSGRSGSMTAAALDRLADELVGDLRTCNARLGTRLDALTQASVLLAGTWSRQSLGDPWLVAELLRDAKRTVLVARGGASEGHLVEGWVDPAMRRRTEFIQDVAIAAMLHTRRCEAVLLFAEDVRSNGAILAAPGSLAVTLIAQHYGIPVFGVDVATAFVREPVDRADAAPADSPRSDSTTLDLVPPELIARTITAQ